MVFNFYNYYVKKQKTLKFINSDIIGLQFLIYVFNRNTGEFEYGTNKDKFIFRSKNFYIEGHNLNINTDELIFLDGYFSNFEKKNSVNLKLEFLNFVSTVFSLSPKSFLIFDDGTVRVQEGTDTAEDLNAEFKIKFEGFFIVKTVIIMKILNYILRYSQKLDEFEIVLGESNKCKWLKAEVNDTIILTEIAGDISEITDSGDDEEDEVFCEIDDVDIKTEE
jgi:hypothetical protein